MSTKLDVSKGYKSRRRRDELRILTIQRVLGNMPLRTQKRFSSICRGYLGMEYLCTHFVMYLACLPKDTR